MSRGTKLQEMEQSKTAVNANAAKSDPLPKEGSNAAGVQTPGNSPPFEYLGVQPQKTIALLMIQQN